MKKLIPLLVGLAVASAAKANSVSELEKNFFSIQTVSIEKIEDDTDKSLDDYLRLQNDDCAGDSGLVMRQQDFDISLDQIINIGKKIWEVIVANKPVVDVQTSTANALPKGIQCWDQLENWQFPKAQSYRIVYKNLMGVEVVRFTFRVIFTYGGQFNGTGHYITNATIIPAEVRVVWGYTFNAKVNVAKVVNLGSRRNPKAGLEMSMDWVVKNPLIEDRKVSTFFLSGTGELASYQ
jgi:hypothetical protein